MARPKKPWYRSSRKAWYVEIDGRQELLIRGPKNGATKAEAEQRFHTLMAERLVNPPVDGEAPTVASVIEAFLEYTIRRDAPRTYYERMKYLQAFAEACGWRRIDACKPYHLTRWIDSHPTWVSDWTRSYAVRAVKRPFNWACNQGLIARNPFGPVSQRYGGPRRPMTQEEFTRIIRALGPVRVCTPASRTARIRFLEAFLFLWLSGARPSEARLLKWIDIDFDRCQIVLQQH